MFCGQPQITPKDRFQDQPPTCTLELAESPNWKSHVADFTDFSTDWDDRFLDRSDLLTFGGISVFFVACILGDLLPGGLRSSSVAVFLTPSVSMRRLFVQLCGLSLLCFLLATSR